MFRVNLSISWRVRETTKWYNCGAYDCILALLVGDGYIPVITHHQRARKVQGLTSGGTTEGWSFTVKLSQHIFFTSKSGRLLSVLPSLYPNRHSKALKPRYRTWIIGRQPLYDPTWSATVECPIPVCIWTNVPLRNAISVVNCICPELGRVSCAIQFRALGPLLFAMLGLTGCFTHCLSYHLSIKRYSWGIFYRFFCLCNIISCALDNVLFCSAANEPRLLMSSFFIYY